MMHRMRTRSYQDQIKRVRKEEWAAAVTVAGWQGEEGERVQQGWGYGGAGVHSPGQPCRDGHDLTEMVRS